MRERWTKGDSSWSTCKERNAAEARRWLGKGTEIALRAVVSGRRAEHHAESPTTSVETSRLGPPSSDVVFQVDVAKHQWSHAVMLRITSVCRVARRTRGLF